MSRPISQRQPFTLVTAVAGLGTRATETMRTTHGGIRRSFPRIRVLRSCVAKIQATANNTGALESGAGVEALYGLYHDQAIVPEGMPDWTIQITCYADETTVPSVLGGPQDLNFDGDAQDNLGGIVNGVDLKVVPMQFVLTHGNTGAAQPITAYRLITKTTM